MTSFYMSHRTDSEECCGTGTELKSNESNQDWYAKQAAKQGSRMKVDEGDDSMYESDSEQPETDSLMDSGSLTDSGSLSSGTSISEESATLSSVPTETVAKEPPKSSLKKRSGSSSPKRGVCFSKQVGVVEFQDDLSSDEDEYFTDLKGPDMSKPIFSPVEYTPEEKAQRKLLSGCIRAEKRPQPDFARMYGCGKSVRVIECTDDDDDDDDLLFSKPVRVIQARAPSAMWFSAF